MCGYGGLGCRDEKRGKTQRRKKSDEK
ncbi:uncharacterized protein G2W53_044876 [Senna tora]|uniref:Uncharacterized protein n=1 Tax=Senna tora TaxID=362788 RepID=A0A834SC31_9FABA|nr:uncharacterized protein G2W53_044876 [Senna tora]